MSENIGKLIQKDITQEMKKSYLNYAMSVIVARALPDVRDGLKPVHRRILFAMSELGLGPSSKFLKSARIVGETMGKYHPHGDSAIYDSLVRLAQDFNMRYPLVWGQGNFGSIDGDPAAASRYTEAKLQAITQELLIDIDKDTVEFGPNYDGSFQEPLYLPAKLPNLLLMGSEGIAVGMATKIPPHNLGEVIDAIVFMIKRTKVGTVVAKTDVSAVHDLANREIENQTGEAPAYAKQSQETDAVVTGETTFHCDVTIDELLEHIKGPDFPTAGSIYDINEIKSAYMTGRGKIVVRGKAEIEEISNGKSAITITEIPYQVNKAQLVAKIADLAKEKKLDGISDLRDESDRRGLRIYVELKRDATPKKVLNNLYKQTALQSTFPVNMVALIDGIPQTLNLKLILEEYLKHRYRVVKRRSEFELRQAKARLHILEGLKIAVDHIDAVIATIRASKDQETAKLNLIEKFKLSEIQATAILDMQLRRLAALERQKIEDELKMVQETIDYLEDLLAHGEKILDVIKGELTKLREKYDDPRRTKVYKSKVDEFSEEDLIPNEPTVITLTNTGYIKRQAMNAFHTQHRGGKGVTGMNVKEEDGIFHIKAAMTHDNIIFFTNRGKAYALRAYEIAESSRTSKGSAIVNLLNIEAGEKVESFIVLNTDVKEGYIFLTTRNGTVKKTHIKEFENIRRNGMIAIKLDAGDELVWSSITDGKSDVLIITKEGKAIRFSEDSVRPLGRATTGVRGIKIGSKDQVIGMAVIKTGTNPDLVAIMENGLGKKTPVSQFPLQGRGGQGVKVAKVTDRTGEVVVANVLPHNSEELIITSKKGQIVKLPINQIPKLSRDTQGVILMRFSHAKDGVASATAIKIDSPEE